MTTTPTPTTAGGSRGLTTARTMAVPGLNKGESATFRILDTGSALYIHGDATGMRPGTVYSSLLYKGPGCSAPESPSGLTVIGTFRGVGNGRQTLDQVIAGSAYRQLRGNIGSESIRAETAATNSGGGNFTTTYQARACAAVVPGR